MTEKRTRPPPTRGELHLDPAAVGRVLDRVVDEVDQDAADLVGVADDVGQVGRRVEHELVTALEVRELGLDDVPCEPQRVARHDRHVQRAGVEPARPEDVVDRAREPLGLAGDDVEHLRALVVVERDIAPPQRHRRAVDRGERRAQLVGDRRDELRAHRLERPLLGQVAEGVDDAVRHGDAVQREPQLARPEVERQRLRPRRRDRRPRRRPGRARRCSPSRGSPRRRAGRARRRAAGPLRPQRPGSTCGRTPRRSTKKTPSPTEASTRAACARSSASR